MPFANNTFTNDDLQLVSNAVLKACDHLDGVADGMVSNSQACTTRRVKPLLQALRCEAGKTTACLAADQVEAILNIYASGAPNSRGKPQYAPWMWDAGIAGCTSAADCNVAGRDQHQRRLALVERRLLQSGLRAARDARRRTARSTSPAWAAARSRCSSRRRRSCRRRLRTTASPT